MPIYNNRVCKACGKTFSGGPRSWYCPDCCLRRRRERDSLYKKNGSNRKLGTKDYCVKCGKLYTVVSGLQKYCPDCAPMCVAEIDRQQGLNYYRQNKDNINPARNSARSKPKGEITCKICGKTFVGYKHQKFCSDECREINRKAYNRDYEKSHPNRKKVKK